MSGALLSVLVAEPATGTDDRPVREHDEGQNLASSQCSMPAWLIVLALLVHAVLFGYDLVRPDAFLNADRALQRMQRIAGLLASTGSPASLQEHLASQGIVGDYAVQGFLYGLGGQSGVVLVQIVLVVLSVIAFWSCLSLLG